MLKSERGFTLLELLVSVLIMGILAAVALSQYRKALLNTYLQDLKPLVAALAQAQERYYLEYGVYALRFTDLDIALSGGYQTVYGTAYSMYYFKDKNVGKPNHCTIQPTHVECVDVSSGSWMIYRQYYAHAKGYENKRACVVASANLNALANQICKKDTKNPSSSTYLNWTTWTYK